PAGRVPVLLARLRDQRRVLRLLPRLSRVLEAVRYRIAGSGPQEALLSKCAEGGSRAFPRRFHGLTLGSGLAADLGTMGSHMTGSHMTGSHTPGSHMPASYLITGGAGFIGSHLAEELLRRGQRVRVVDSLITGKRRNLEHLSGVEFLEGDLADQSVARRAVEG